MVLSDISIRRPVVATVLNLLLVTFGLVSITQLQVREFPDIEPPIVTIETSYTGASATVVERRITQLIEDQISVVEAIKSIESSSEDGRSLVTVEFNVDRDIDAAANDLREAALQYLDNCALLTATIINARHSRQHFIAVEQRLHLTCTEEKILRAIFWNKEPKSIFVALNATLDKLHARREAIHAAAVTDDLPVATHRNQAPAQRFDLLVRNKF